MVAPQDIGRPTGTAAVQSCEGLAVGDAPATESASLPVGNLPLRPPVTLLPSPRRRGPALETLTDVRREMARVYRNMRHGRIDTQDATRMTYVLSQIAKIIQTAELDARVAAVERALGSRKP